MTPLSTSTPYLTTRDVLTFVDWRQLADLSYDGDGPRPTRMSLLDTTRDSGMNLFQNMLGACGEMESSLVAGGRYQPVALLNLSQMSPPLAGGMWLKRILATLTLWSMAWHREPLDADPKQVPGAMSALNVLEKLRQGETILPYVEAAQAGGGPQTVRMPEAEIIRENQGVFPRNNRSPWGY